MKFTKIYNFLNYSITNNIDIMDTLDRLCVKFLHSVGVFVQRKQNVQQFPNNEIP